MGRLWVPRAGWFDAPSACRVSRAGACDERVQNCPHLQMRLFPAACRADVALVELCRNGVVARCPARLLSSMIGRTLVANRLALAFRTALPRFATSAMCALHPYIDRRADGVIE